MAALSRDFVLENDVDVKALIERKRAEPYYRTCAVLTARNILNWSSLISFITATVTFFYVVATDIVTDTLARICLYSALVSIVCCVAETLLRFVLTRSAVRAFRAANGVGPLFLSTEQVLKDRDVLLLIDEKRARPIKLRLLKDRTTWYPWMFVSCTLVAVATCVVVLIVFAVYCFTLASGTWPPAEPKPWVLTKQGDDFASGFMLAFLVSSEAGRWVSFFAGLRALAIMRQEDASADVVESKSLKAEP